MTETAARRRIVAGVDPSDHAARAAAWAAREAADRGLTLHLVHALDFPAPSGMISSIGYVESAYQSGEKLLDPLADELRLQHPGLTVTTEISEFSAPETLVAMSHSAQLVVTGTRGHGGFAGLLLGSVSLRTAAHAHCPVVVVRGLRDDGPLDEIVLGVEPHEPAAPIEFAFASAAALGARLVVARAWWPTAAYGGYYFCDDTSREHDEAEELAGLIKSAREAYPEVRVSTRIMRDNAVPALIQTARGSRLLVVGAHRRRSPLSVGAGYVVQGLLSHSPTPVAVVPIS
jgi:nucleotide-binding universal stress UspA family protein